MGFRALGEPFAVLGGNRGLGKAPSKGVTKFNQIATFEGGLTTPNPTGFDAVTTAGGGAIAVTNAAALRGQFGFAITLGGAGHQAYGALNGPNNENEATVQFLLNMNNLPMGAGNVFSFLWLTTGGAGGLAFLINLVFAGGVHQFQMFGRNDAGVNVGGASLAINSLTTQCVRINYKASSAPGADDGFIRVYLDGALFHQINFIDNDTQLITALQVGAIAGVDAATIGTFFLDNVQWADRLL